MKLLLTAPALLMAFTGVFVSVLSARPAPLMASLDQAACIGTVSYQLDAEAQSNAAVVIAITTQMGLSPRAAVIALGTALQESGLHNHNYGDAAGPDSRGIFQQRSSWGPLEVRMDPAGATRLFLASLTKVAAWDALPLGVVALAVQHFQPQLIGRYQGQEPAAKAILASYTTQSCATNAASVTGPGGDTSCCAKPTYAVRPLFPWVPVGGFPTWGYAAGNCTWWAAYNHRVPAWSGHGDGGQWFGNAIADHIATSRAPSVGAVVSYSGPGYSIHGHVALVKGVRPDGSFVVSEMNYLGLDIISERVDSLSNKAINGFVVG
jgi:hypothetical protein